MIDYATPADRLGTSLEAKRAQAIAYLRSRGKYIADQGCTFVPTPAAHTDVQATMVNAMQSSINDDIARFCAGLPTFLRRQAA